jgi:mannitol/fructose-specific phosphotransferase system IIA component (Ntr-type)
MEESIEKKEKVIEKKEENSKNEILEKITEYLKNNNIQLSILTPCYGASCNINYVESLITTINFFNGVGLKHKIFFCHNDSLVSRARNNLIARAMSDQQTTHILFIDNDIRWEPYDIIKLLMSNKQLIGGVYPLKKYLWNKLLDPDFIQKILETKKDTPIENLISDEKMIQHNLLRYNTNYNNLKIEIHNNLTQVKHLPTGFMMIRREVIEKMFVEYNETKYNDDVGFLTEKEEKYTYALFDCGVVDKHYYSEDWLFCHRWAKIGGEIWIDITIKLVHSGMENYDGNYLCNLMANGLNLKKD